MRGRLALYVRENTRMLRTVLMRIMAIDYGDARIGIAVSDPTGLICGEAWTLQEWNAERAAQTISAEAEKREVKTIVLGLPKNMNGTEGPRAEKSREFKKMLEAQTDKEIVLWDERRSSIEAHAILHNVGKKEKKHRESVDAVAASLILEGYLDSKKT